MEGKADELHPILEIFEQIAAIPHGSRNEQALSDYLVRYARERGFKVYQDDVQNVIIKLPASAGRENAAAVILQGHMDMVCEKSAASAHDFTKDPLTLVYDGDSLHADGTTLGADNAIALAYGLALLESDAPHSPVELLFTVDEESSMKGVKSFDPALFDGRMLINLDSAGEGMLTVSCAGGIGVDYHIPITLVPAAGDAYRLTVSGLLGGHSGGEIDKERGNANMESVQDKFFRYVRLDTQSVRDAAQVPSTASQRAMAELLKEELLGFGVEDVHIDEHAFLYARLPATSGLERKLPIGFIAHMDTSPEAPGHAVCPRLVEHYDGGDIILNAEKKRVLSPTLYEHLLHYVGEDLIVTDGSTLLGADDKAGIAEIMSMAETLITQKIPHGPLCLAFTPDEEVGGGIQKFDVGGFGARFAYTVDGGQVGEIEYESFNAADVLIVLNGLNVHTGEAKHKLKNALLIAMELNAMLPVFENPACTDGYEGFQHLFSMQGNTERTDMQYLLRDHDLGKFQAKKVLFEKIAEFLNRKYGENTVEVSFRDSYFNMRNRILPHMHLVEYAEQAMRDAEVEPRVIPIRGGTDGSHLSFMGLPCPNLSTGGHNAHGYYEYIPVSSLGKMTKCLLGIVAHYAARPDERQAN